MLKEQTIYDVLEDTLEDDFNADDDIAMFDDGEDEDFEDILHSIQCDAVKNRLTIH